MIEALSVSGAFDLAPLSRYLHDRRVRHRISERGTQQVVWVAVEQDVELVRLAYAQLQSGELPKSEKHLVEASASDWSLARLRRVIASAPLVLLLIFASVVVSLGNNWSGQQWFFDLRMGSLAYVWESGEFWRPITPIFMHFSVMHCVFNMLMLWVFGLQMELRKERSLLLLLVLSSAVFSNSAQYYVSGSGFGGMSGVVFALLAYCWCWDQLRPTQAYGFPNALMGLMMLWLALGYTDFMHWVGFGAMANTAHLSGLLFGLFFAWGAHLLRPKTGEILE